MNSKPGFAGENSFYSQFGEDRLLNEIFGFKKSGLCVEVGANNGMDDSTSYFFEKNGWHCILIEPNPELAYGLRRDRSGEVFECAVSDKPGFAQLTIVEGADRSHGMSSINDSSGFQQHIQDLGFSTRVVPTRVRTLDSILDDARTDSDIDFISIDVEGLELSVLKGLSLDRWRPRIILLEDNSHFSNNDVANYLANFGYQRFRRTGVNDWFAHVSDRELVHWRSGLRVFMTKLSVKFYRHVRQTELYRRLQSLYRKAK